MAASAAFGGGPSGTSMGDSPHPEPRVIIDILRVSGPHDRGDVEREARRLLWGKIVGCYRPALQTTPKLRGEAVFKFRADARGKASGVHKVRATMPDDDVVKCWAKVLRGLPLPEAPRASDVVIQIHVAPGDPPSGD
jgi:hypothetical protein